MNGYLWSGGAAIGLLGLGGGTSPQGRWNRSLPPYASARTPVDHGEVPEFVHGLEKIAQRRLAPQKRGPGKRSLRIEASMNSHSNLSALIPSHKVRVPSVHETVHETDGLPFILRTRQRHPIKAMASRRTNTRNIRWQLIPQDQPEHAQVVIGAPYSGTHRTIEAELGPPSND